MCTGKVEHACSTYRRIMHDLTIAEKARAADKFLAWLRDKYPVANTKIHTEYPPVKSILNKYVTARLLYNGEEYKIEVAAARPVNHVVQSVGHEYKHIRQVVLEGVPHSKIGNKEEVAAWAFSSSTMIEYHKEVGDNWR